MHTNTKTTTATMRKNGLMAQNSKHRVEGASVLFYGGVDPTYSSQTHRLLPSLPFSFHLSIRHLALLALLALVCCVMSTAALALGRCIRCRIFIMGVRRGGGYFLLGAAAFWGEGGWGSLTIYNE
ncbi:hypothetical protein EV126DRAFT_77240 [Verticillium dahliae]|nr:hypothetical protein EV126DRAFT_77240 [Verticillium dahliae]